jgi:subtilase family protein/peptidase inhibitor I9
MVRIALMAFGVLCAASAAFAQAELAPLRNQGVRGAIPNRYIVVMKSGVSREAMGDIRQRITGIGGKVVHVYTSALNGFSVEISPEGLQALRVLPDVDYIEVDQLGSGDTLQPPNPAGAPPSGIDRIDRRLTPLNGTYSYSETGAGVNAYIIDSGIRATHSDFGGRASGAIDFVGDGNGTNDCHGHGTNVAGIVGGSQFGVAKNVTIHAVRVLDCMNRGFVSNFIAGLDWVINNAIQPAVANMSLGADNPSTAFDTAVTNLVNAGVPVTLAAGNNNVDACGASPARTPVAITVGATEPATDARASFSNFGPCLDIFAPGVSILSAGIASDTATSTFTGTSQAAPHVAGVAARFLQTHPAATPADVLAAIHAAADITSTPGWGGIGNPGAGSPNELLHWGSFNDGQIDGDPQTPMLYRAKFVCGQPVGNTLAPGRYFTVINVHNPIEDPSAEPISFTMKFAVAPPPKEGHTQFSSSFDVASDNVREVSCGEIIREAHGVANLCSASFCEGFVVIESQAELDVTAIYTAANLNPPQQVRALHTTRVLPHCPIRTEVLPEQTVLFVPPKVGGGDADYDGNGPCVDFKLALRLEDGDKTLAAHYRMHAFECDGNFMKPRHDFTTAKGEEKLILKVASPRGRIIGYNANSTMSQSYIDTNHSSDDFDYFDPNSNLFNPFSPVKKLSFVGDTVGDEAGTRTGVFITFSAMRVELETCPPAQTAQSLTAPSRP